MDGLMLKETKPALKGHVERVVLHQAPEMNKFH